MNTLRVQVILAAFIASLAFAGGWHLCDTVQDGEVANIHLMHQVMLGQAQSAKIKADERATMLEQKHTQALSSAAATFEEDRYNDKITSDRRIADLSARVTSLRVDTQRTYADNHALPGTATGAGGSDGTAAETLSGSVAARLAQRYSDYNELVDQITLCQRTVEIDRVQ